MNHSSSELDQYHVPSCTQAYYKACTEPFKDVPNVCLPCTVLPLPTRKFTTRATVQWSTNAAGIGLLLLQPSSTWTNGTTTIYASSSTYTGSQATVVSAITTGMSGMAVQSPMAGLPATSSNILVRLVTYAVRTEAVTPGMNRGGILFGNQSMERADLQVAGLGRSLLSCFGDTASTRVPFGTDSTTMTLLGAGPTLPGHIDLLPANDASLVPAWSMVGCFSTSAQSLVSECIFYWEVIEQLNPAGLTPSHAEPSFAGAVVAAVNSVVADNPAGEDHASKSIKSRILAIAKEGWKAVAPVVKAVAPKLARGALSMIPYAGPALAAIGSAAAPAAIRAVQRAIAARPQPSRLSIRAAPPMQRRH